MSEHYKQNGKQRKATSGVLDRQMFSAVFAELLHVEIVCLLPSFIETEYQGRNECGCLCWSLFESNGCLGIESGYGYYVFCDLMDLIIYVLYYE